MCKLLGVFSFSGLFYGSTDPWTPKREEKDLCYVTTMMICTHLGVRVILSGGAYIRVLFSSRREFSPFHTADACTLEYASCCLASVTFMHRLFSFNNIVSLPWTPAKEAASQCVDSTVYDSINSRRDCLYVENMFSFSRRLFRTVSWSIK